MPKRNAFLQRQQIIMNHELNETRKHTIQVCSDIALITANEVFGAGKERLKTFNEAFCENFAEYLGTTYDDLKDDKALTYSISLIERKLQEICKEYYIPREVRYK